LVWNTEVLLEERSLVWKKEVLVWKKEDWVVEES